jgi:hypothetical protein
MEFNFDAEPYQRMLAKIALGSAILQYGTKFFDPIVCPFFRGKEPESLGKYVFGYDLDQEVKPFMGATHTIIFEEHTVRGTRYLVGFVRLFAVYDTPTNAVIVGIVKDDAPVPV